MNILKRLTAVTAVAGAALALSAGAASADTNTVRHDDDHGHGLINLDDVEVLNDVNVIVPVVINDVNLNAGLLSVLGIVD